MNIPMFYYCDVCEELYASENAANKCRQLPLEEVKFSLGATVLVGAGKNIPQTGTVVGIKYIAGFSGGKHFASYTVELPDKSLVLRNARSLKLYTPTTHPNKQEILDGIASGREWEFRGTGEDKWINTPDGQKLPSWLPNHEYRLKPITNPHPNKKEVRKGVAEGKAWQYRRKGTSEWINPTQPFGPTFGPTWNEKHDYRLVPIEEPPSKDEPNPHPNRAEVEAGIAAGKQWEVKRKTAATWTKARLGRSPIWSVHHDYRLTPEPEYVPLGPEDVHPLDMFRQSESAESIPWYRPVCIDDAGISFHAGGLGFGLSYSKLFSLPWQINRSLPLTGKWDANAWEPCKKLKQ